MKFVETMVVFREVPDEITLAINISHCPVQCPGCHSPYLAEDIGEVLDEGALRALIADNPGISCVSFMGGDAEPAGILALSRWVKATYPDLKTFWYSGRDLDTDRPFATYLDYLKVGPFVEAAGPLDSPTTNQRFYAVSHTPDGEVFTDRTARFRR